MIFQQQMAEAWNATPVEFWRVMDHKLDTLRGAKGAVKPLTKAEMDKLIEIDEQRQEGATA